MVEIVFVGDNSNVTVPDVGVFAKKGEPIEVDEGTAEFLIEKMPGQWKRKTESTKTGQRPKEE